MLLQKPLPRRLHLHRPLRQLLQAGQEDGISRHACSGVAKLDVVNRHNHLGNLAGPVLDQ